MTTPLIGRVIVLPAIIAGADVPQAESPAQHVRNALMLLGLIEQISPATWHLNTELGRAKRRAETALALLEYNAPSAFVARHLRGAIESLLDGDVDWEVITEIPAATARLLVALFLTDAA